MEVCIIGGGYSGITTAKISLDHGLIPFILEKKFLAGGLWNALDRQIGVWDSLESNISKHITAFSDYVWPAEDPEFPTAKQTLEYLNRYIEMHQLNQYIHFGCEVIDISQFEEDYRVTWKYGEEVNSKVFRYIIVASGLNAKERIPFKNFEIFRGTIIPGGLYREPSCFAGKRVVTIGKSNTASDIALEAVESAASVTQIYKKPYFCFPKMFNSVPYDYTLLDIKSASRKHELILTPSTNIIIGKFLLQTYGNPSQYHADWFIDETLFATENFKSTVQVPEYYLAVKEGRIRQVGGEARELYENGVVLTDGTRVEADVLVLGTGYTLDLSFLSQKIREIIQYEETNRMPTIMFRSLFHPSLPRFGFVGLFPSIGRFELQSEIVLRYLMGALDVGGEEVEEGINDDLKARNSILKPKLIYSLTGYFYELIRILKMNIDYDLIKNELGYANGPILPYFFFMERPGQLERCREAIREMKEKHQNFPFI